MIHIGTINKDWLEKTCPADNHPDLLYYTREFTFFELAVADLTGLGDDSIRKLVEQTPGDFRIALVIRPVLTRQTTFDMQELFRLLKEASSNKVACVLVSYPETFQDLPENRETLVWLKDQLEIPLVVEFSSSDWIKKGLKEWLIEHSICMCCSDFPRLAGLAQPVDWVTGPISYVRFHGRNYQKWQDTKARYDYLYDVMELAEWLPKIEDMNVRAETTLVMMNNTPRAQAVDSARILKQLLGIG